MPGFLKESFVFQKLLLNGQIDAAAAEANPGTAGTPWTNTGDCYGVFTDEEQVKVRIRTVSVRNPRIIYSLFYFAAATYTLVEDGDPACHPLSARGCAGPLCRGLAFACVPKEAF